MMHYETAEGATAVQALLHRIADGIGKGKVEVAGMAVASLPTVEASVSFEGGSDQQLDSVVVRLTRFRDTSGPSRPVALERELSRPGG